jgi:hypothetical protein
MPNGTKNLHFTVLGRNRDPELQRIAERAAQMVDNAMSQAAWLPAEKRDRHALATTPK